MTASGDVSFPAAEGVRQQWSSVPAVVRAAVEAELGSPVAAAVSQNGGFSPGVAARVRCANGARYFVKAISSHPNPESPLLHRREARIAAELPASAPVPALRWSYDDAEWVVLVFEDIDGRSPMLPWQPGELTRCMYGVYDLSLALTPSPIDVEPMSEFFEPPFHGWRNFATDEASGAQLPPGWRSRLGDLVVLEEQWPAAVEGNTLLHLDTRADNLLLTDKRVYVVDWPWAAVGAPWVDLVAFLPSVAMQDGPDPQEIWDVHPLAHGVDGDRVDAFLTALAGMFTWQSIQPPSPGLPTLRPFQAGQAKTACAWLARRRAWT